MRYTKRRLQSLLLAPILLALVLGTVGPVAPNAQATEDSSPPLFAEYTLPGNPKNLFVEAPGKVWYTLPDADKVVLLAGNTVTEYATGAGSRPYDLVLDNGLLWVTLLGSNAIGKFTVGNPNSFQSFPIPTANSEPTGISAGGGYIWFVERKGDNLGRLDPANGSIAEFTDKDPNDDNLVDLTGAMLEDVAFSSVGPWITGPSLKSSVAFFRLDILEFRAAPAGGNAQPMAIAIDNTGDTWIAARGTNRLGRFGLNTLGLWQWYDLPAGSAGPDSLFLREANGRRELWYSRSGINRIGAQFVSFGGTAIGQIESELPVSNGAPWGIGVDENGQVWTAATATNKGIAWETPYFQHFLNLPLLRRTTS
jgi:streptogramin lyase